MNSSFILASFQVFHLFSDLTNLSCLVDEQRPNENKQFVRSFHICGGQRMSQPQKRAVEDLLQIFYILEGIFKLNM